MKHEVESKDYIANYELNDYRYDQFWKNREYEHLAEYDLLLKVIKKYLPDLGNRRIIDIGGAFGRLAPLYAHTARETLLADYSIKELKAGMGSLKNTYGNKVKYVALNAYKLPFKKNSLDAVLSVRVMHHLKDTPLFFEELYRTLSPGGIAVIEFANKNHILAIIRNIFSLKKYLMQETLRVNHKSEGSQGMKEGQESIMYNFSFKYVKKTALVTGFEVKKVYSCSFLRNGLLKKLFSSRILLSGEKFFRAFLNPLHITPSLFIVLRKPGVFTSKENTISDILACPLCLEETQLQKDKYMCKNKHSFLQENKSIIDLRDPRPEKIDF